MSGRMCAIWFGILVVKMAEFCLITPPIGLNCFVVAGVRPELSVQDVFRGVTPFFVADAITIALLVSFPAIVLWLPCTPGMADGAELAMAEVSMTSGNLLGRGKRDLPFARTATCVDSCVCDRIRRTPNHG
jgi:hypothetical protein